MERRVLLSLTATAAASLAGCSGGGESGDSGGDSEPTEPIDSSAEELVYSLEDFDEAGWSQANEEIEGNMARREFVNQDGGINQFYATVWYYESESEAENKYQQLNEEATESASTESRDVGNEAFAYEDGTAIVVFRDVNVVGRAEHYGVASGSVDTATEYANMLHSKWRS
jgi:hypothetical protein